MYAACQRIQAQGQPHAAIAGGILGHLSHHQ